ERLVKCSRPVRISQIPNRSIPRLRVSRIETPPQSFDTATLDRLTSGRRPQPTDVPEPMAPSIVSARRESSEDEAMAGILEVRERPQLRRPVLVAGFAGWGNAGAASTGAVEYLLGEPKPPACAAADGDACFDFTVAPPTTTRGGPDGWQ